MQAIESDENSILIQVATKAYALDELIQTNTYAGTGGNEGGADLAGRVKPLCFGKAFNVPAVRVDSTNLVYQVHDGKINDVVAVYDRGVALVKVSVAPAPGEYQVDAPNGRFTLGSIPGGLVTADVEGRHDGTNYLTTVADIIEDIIVSYSQLSSSEIDSASFSALNTAQSAEIGTWINNAATIRDVIDELLLGMGCYGHFTLSSKLKVGQFTAPAAPADFSLTQDDIEDIRRDRLADDLTPIAWRYRVAYKRNYAVQNALASGVPDAVKEFAELEYRIAADADASLTSTYILATDPAPQISPMNVKADADSETTRQLAIYRVPRALYTLTVKPALWTAEIGHSAFVDYPRYGLNGGAYGRVVAVDLDAERNTTELVMLL